MVCTIWGMWFRGQSMSSHPCRCERESVSLSVNRTSFLRNCAWRSGWLDCTTRHFVSASAAPRACADTDGESWRVLCAVCLHIFAFDFIRFSAKSISVNRSVSWLVVSLQIYIENITYQWTTSVNVYIQYIYCACKYGCEREWAMALWRECLKVITKSLCVVLPRFVCAFINAATTKNVFKVHACFRRKYAIQKNWNPNKDCMSNTNK